MLNGSHQEQTLQMDALLTGYEDFCEFDTAQLILIEPLRSFRIIQYMAWLSRRWQDSAFQRAFPVCRKPILGAADSGTERTIGGLDEAPLNLGFNG